MTIGIGITTRNRPDILAETLREFDKYTPSQFPIIVVDDASDPPVKNAYLRFPVNRGIAAAKNKCMEILDGLGVEHMFLFDDDTRPTADGWWEPYVESPEPHLMYQFPAAPSHWTLKVIGGDDRHLAYDRSRGCMLYVERRVLDEVGGMHLAWGKHGGEHGDWSMRIHKAGLTTYAFADVREPSLYCMDQDHKQISSVNWRDEQHWMHVDASALPKYAEWRERPIPVLIPYRTDHGYRDRLWEYLRDEYWGQLDNYEVFLGEHLKGPFNRSAGINAAARRAGNWDVAVIADNDTWVPYEQLDRAVERARATGHLVSALTTVMEIGERYTRRILDREARPTDLEIIKVRTGELETQSSMLACPRTLWERLGGFDERFVGWGGEDNAFWHAASIMQGAKVHRVHGPAFHLWHPPASTPEQRQYDEDYHRNLLLWERYSKARNMTQLQKVLRDG